MMFSKKKKKITDRCPTTNLIKKTGRGLGGAQLIACFLSMQEVPGSTSSTAQTGQGGECF